MRRFLLLSGLFLLLTACSSTPIQLYPGAERPASEIATLRVPIEVEVYSLNGKKLDSAPAILGTADRQLQLLPGHYKLLVFYSNIWQITADEHTTVKSQPVAFDLQLQTGHTYQLDFTEAGSYNEAKQFEDHFQPWITDKKTRQKIVSQDSGLKFGGNFLQQITGQTKLVKVGKTDDAGHQIIAPLAADAAATSAAATGAATAPPPVTPGSTRRLPTTTPTSYLNLLKAQWNQASKAEKRAFLKWISTHP